MINLLISLLHCCLGVKSVTGWKRVNGKIVNRTWWISKIMSHHWTRCFMFYSITQNREFIKELERAMWVKNSNDEGGSTE